jgi:predicted lysophospholipase L1 biosynthesis ABC-type transport system permease subunit
VKHDLVLSLRDLAVLASGMVAGGQVLLLFAVFPALRVLDPREAFHFHQAAFSTDLPDRYIQPSGIVSMVAGVALLALAPGTAADIALTAIGIAGIAAVAVVTRTVNRPINRQVGTWTDEHANDYPRLRARWERGHAVRTTCGLLSFASYIALASH